MSLFYSEYSANLQAISVQKYENFNFLLREKL